MGKAKLWIARLIFIIMLSCTITPEMAMIIDAPVVTSAEAAYNRATVKKVQEKLNQKGYSCGTADGIAGSKTKNAIKKYQKDHNLTVTGTINSALLKSLNIKPVSNSSSSSDTKIQNKETTVYITDTGSKYHRSGCRYLRKSKYSISLSNAKAQGYTPCSVCKP
ncbi:peptidoglycan-binding domain-containing protein [Velocimicrobium porci]|uniref:Peptidoglycan-binding protein n=1 Tax=Velocimicrobium porci TaxID=2606634 RepID=A0A6L5XXX9_9FIRM|nr:peptidoglycan-binding domain-containing protein [Velocimicrobium porci]MSS63635.1 peptidoglycan-binding protein [Velocimicrobium porci]